MMKITKDRRIKDRRVSDRRVKDHFAAVHQAQERLGIVPKNQEDRRG